MLTRHFDPLQYEGFNLECDRFAPSVFQMLQQVAGILAPLLDRRIGQPAVPGHPCCRPTRRMGPDPVPERMRGVLGVQSQPSVAPDPAAVPANEDLSENGQEVFACGILANIASN